MNTDRLSLISVNWEHGMLLTPQHFLRQERYLDSSISWLLRYATDRFGLVGGGPRLEESERGAIRHDPVVAVDEDQDAINVTISQCRGLTPGGCIIDVDAEHAIHGRFAKADVSPESEIYIVCDLDNKEVRDGAVDEFNPHMMTERHPSYALSLQLLAGDVPYSMVVARLKKARYGAGFEKDGNFIPPCVSMASFSELAAAWRRITEEVSSLAERYMELHRAMQDFIRLFKDRGIETETDLESMGFVGRMVMALQNCMYEIADPVQPPQRFFAQVRRCLHGAAVSLDLSPPVRQYFDLLKETGETEFISLLEQQKNLLSSTPKWAIHDDLSVEVRSVMQSLAGLRRLETALEGKYIDFRVNRALDAMNFVFDRGGNVLYKLAAKPSRVQGVADAMTMTFAQLRLEGREKYRLILAGEQNADFNTGTPIRAEIRVNEGSGFNRPPIFVSSESKSSEQRNFEFDFDAPDVQTITDLRVILPAHYPIRTALLFVRQRFFASRQDESARSISPEPKPPLTPPAPANRLGRTLINSNIVSKSPATRLEPELPPQPQPPSPARRSQPSETPAPRGGNYPTWEPPAADRPRQESDIPPTRRRRLE